MNTNQQTNDSDKPKDASKRAQGKKKIDFFFAGGNSNSVSNVVSALSSVDTKSPDAEENEHSISDNNGGRIELNEDGTKVIRK